MHETDQLSLPHAEHSFGYWIALQVGTVKTPIKLFFTIRRDVPNSTLPVLVFRVSALISWARQSPEVPETFSKHSWTGIWTDTIYDYTHFHSNAHEVLGIPFHRCAQQRQVGELVLRKKNGFAGQLTAFSHSASRSRTVRPKPLAMSLTVRKMVPADERPYDQRQAWSSAGARILASKKPNQTPFQLGINSAG